MREGDAISEDILRVVYITKNSIIMSLLRHRLYTPMAVSHDMSVSKTQ